MEFLSEYYLWFIIGGIILVMAIIGYIADKTDFGRKNKATDTDNKLKDDKKEIVNNEPVVAEAPVVEEVSDNSVETELINTNINTDINDIDAPIVDEPSLEVNDINVEEQKVEENLNGLDLKEKDNEISITNDISSNNIGEGINVEEVVDDSSYILSNDLSSFAAGTVNLNENSVTEPTIEKVEEVVIDQDSDDDIWKF